jgi:hypothetical protein
MRMGKESKLFAVVTEFTGSFEFVLDAATEQEALLLARKIGIPVSSHITISKQAIRARALPTFALAARPAETGEGTRQAI